MHNDFMGKAREAIEEVRATGSTFLWDLEPEEAEGIQALLSREFAEPGYWIKSPLFDEPNPHTQPSAWAKWYKNRLAIISNLMRSGDAKMRLKGQMMRDELVNARRTSIYIPKQQREVEYSTEYEGWYTFWLVD